MHPDWEPFHSKIKGKKKKKEVPAQVKEEQQRLTFLWRPG
jgi:hypothetical protein